MSWVTVIWSMVASACLTLAALHTLVWCRRRTKWDYILFALAAMGTAGMSFCELWMMRTETPEQFAAAARWFHVPAWVSVLALIGFVRIHLRAGRLWIALAACALRTLSLLLNFTTGQNLNFRAVIHLRHIPFLGEVVAFGEGVPNPWMLVGQVSVLVLLIFAVDAAITVWRRGDRLLALTVGGSIVFFVLAATLQAVLVMWGFVHEPITVSVFFAGAVVAMVLEMSRDAVLAAQLADDLRESEARYRGIFEGAAEGMFRTSV